MKSLAAQNAFWPMPGFISCAGACSQKQESSKQLKSFYFARESHHNLCHCRGGTAISIVNKRSLVHVHRGVVYKSTGKRAGTITRNTYTQGKGELVCVAIGELY